MMQKKLLAPVLAAAVLLVAAKTAEGAADFANPLSLPSLSIRRQRLLAPIIVGVRSALPNPGRGGSRSQAYDDRATSVQLAREHDEDEAIVGPLQSVAMARGGGDDGGPVCNKLLKWAYATTGVALTAAWSTMTYTTIRSNQPAGAMMPSPQHAVFARMVRLFVA